MSNREKINAENKAVRSFAANILIDIESGKLLQNEQIRDFCWRLIEFEHKPQVVSHQLGCLAARLQEQRGRLATERAQIAQRLAAEVETGSSPASQGGTSRWSCKDLDTATLPAFPYGSLVHSCWKLASGLDELDLGMLSLVRVRQKIYPIVNTNRVDNRAGLLAALPELLGGNLRAMNYYEELTSLLEDSVDQ